MRREDEQALGAHPYVELPGGQDVCNHEGEAETSSAAVKNARHPRCRYRQLLLPFFSDAFVASPAFWLAE